MGGQELCSICHNTVNISDLVILSLCKHKYCFSCWSSHVKQILKDKKTTLHCVHQFINADHSGDSDVPHHMFCSAEPDIEDVRLIGDESLVNAFQAFKAVRGYKRRLNTVSEANIRSEYSPGHSSGEEYENLSRTSTRLHVAMDNSFPQNILSDEQHASLEDLTALSMRLSAAPSPTRQEISKKNSSQQQHIAMISNSSRSPSSIPRDLSALERSPVAPSIMPSPSRIPPSEQLQATASPIDLGSTLGSVYLFLGDPKYDLSPSRARSSAEQNDQVYINNNNIGDTLPNSIFPHTENNKSSTLNVNPQDNACRDLLAPKQQNPSRGYSSFNTQTTKNLNGLNEVHQDDSNNNLNNSNEINKKKNLITEPIPIIQLSNSSSALPLSRNEGYLPLPLLPSDSNLSLHAVHQKLNQSSTDGGNMNRVASFAVSADLAASIPSPLPSKSVEVLLPHTNVSSKNLGANHAASSHKKISSLTPLTGLESELASPVSMNDVMISDIVLDDAIQRCISNDLGDETLGLLLVTSSSNEDLAPNPMSSRSAGGLNELCCSCHRNQTNDIDALDKLNNPVQLQPGVSKKNDDSTAVTIITNNVTAQQQTIDTGRAQVQTEGVEMTKQRLSSTATSVERSELRFHRNQKRRDTLTNSCNCPCHHQCVSLPHHPNEATSSSPRASASAPPSRGDALREAVANLQRQQQSPPPPAFVLTRSSLFPVSPSDVERVEKERSNQRGPNHRTTASRRRNFVTPVFTWGRMFGISGVRSPLEDDSCGKRVVGCSQCWVSFLSVLVFIPGVILGILVSPLCCLLMSRRGKHKETPEMLMQRRRQVGFYLASIQKPPSSDVKQKSSARIAPRASAEVVPSQLNKKLRVSGGAAPVNSSKSLPEVTPVMEGRISSSSATSGSNHAVVGVMATSLSVEPSPSASIVGKQLSVPLQEAIETGQIGSSHADDLDQFACPVAGPQPGAPVREGGRRASKKNSVTGKDGVSAEHSRTASANMNDSATSMYPNVQSVATTCCDGGVCRPVGCWGGDWICFGGNRDAGVKQSAAMESTCAVFCMQVADGFEQGILFGIDVLMCLVCPAFTIVFGLVSALCVLIVVLFYKVISCFLTTKCGFKWCFSKKKEDVLGLNGITSTAGGGVPTQVAPVALDASHNINYAKANHSTGSRASNSSLVPPIHPSALSIFDLEKLVEEGMLTQNFLDSLPSDAQVLQGDQCFIVVRPASKAIRREEAIMPSQKEDDAVSEISMEDSVGGGDLETKGEWPIKEKET